MGFFQALTDFFESIFMSSSPEVKKRQDLRRIENTLKEWNPVIFKNGLLQPNFAEGFHILYENTKPIEDILSQTICSDDVQRNTRFEEQLILTGFTPEQQNQIQSLTYANRKATVLQSDYSMTRLFEEERHTMEKLIKAMNTPEFAHIDEIIDRLHQLTDICRFSYVTAIRIFDADFNTSGSYKPYYQAVTPEVLETVCMDLYYLTAKFEISAAMGRAIIALDQLKNGKTPDAQQSGKVMESLRKIETVFKHILTPDILLSIAKLAKKDPALTPQTASYKSNTRQKFATHLEDQFRADENRIKIEVKDATIQSEVRELFPSQELLTLQGYNNEVNDMFRKSTSFAFMWITPLQVLKTFLTVYYSEPIKAFLNDVVIEGFFNNPSYKSDFSSVVYACNESLDRIEKFEATFAHGGENDEALLTGLLRDSHKDQDFIKKLSEMVDSINVAAKQLTQNEATNLFGMYVKIGELIVDARKPTPDTISNLKVLVSSSRNHDNAELMEQQYGQWKIFLEILKNYAIIGDIEKNT